MTDSYALKDNVEYSIRDGKALNKKQIAKLYILASPRAIEDCLKMLLDEGKILRDARYYYRHTSVYHPTKRAPKKVTVPNDIEEMFQQIGQLRNNLLEDTKNAIEEARRLKIENQNLVEKIVRINSLLHNGELR